MKISDILGMSLTNLWRRKMRTFLTVLGVVIGTASIVVMLSLGMGMKQAIMDEVSQAGGLTEIMVYSDGEFGNSDLLLGDDTIDKFKGIEHVERINPQITYNMPVQVGKYESYLSIVGVGRNVLEDIELDKGEIPQSRKGELSLVVGNQVITDFYEIATGEYPYWENEELPDLDLMKTQMIGGVEIDDNSYEDNMDSFDEPDEMNDFSDGMDDFEEEEYFDESVDDFEEEDSFGDEEMNDFDEVPEEEMEDGDDSFSYFTPSMKRVRLKVSGITVGDVDTYTEYSYNCYTDMEVLKSFLKQNYGINDLIPGQPVNKDGKPFRDLKYTQLVVKVDESAYVEEVLQEIQDMGYQAEANKEWLDEIKKEFMIIEAVLGGIGAVAMLVAAISIANTMTMSTYERTKEIGIMKVLGCNLGDIRTMFLSEAAFIGFLGGVIGIFLSYFLSFLLNQVVSPMIMSEYGDGTNISMIPIWLVFASVLFATFIGMLAGFFPAQRATKLSPLAAIRNE